MAAHVFDATLLLLLTDDRALAPNPPAGTTDTARDRLTFLLETLDESRTDVVVPAPVLTEVLSLARVDVSATLNQLSSLSRVRIEAFGHRAAIECAEMLRTTGRGAGPKAKVKFDHQIVAISKVLGADRVYSDDGGVRALCAREGIECIGVWGLPERPVDPQASLPLEP